MAKLVFRGGIPSDKDLVTTRSSYLPLRLDITRSSITLIRIQNIVSSRTNRVMRGSKPYSRLPP